MTIRVGVGGWTYAPWRGPFYPEGLAHRRELEYAAERLTSIEINATYSSRQKPESWRKWRDVVPPGFQFSLKASKGESIQISFVGFDSKIFAVDQQTTFMLTSNSSNLEELFK